MSLKLFQRKKNPKAVTEELHHDDPIKIIKKIYNEELKCNLDTSISLIFKAIIQIDKKLDDIKTLSLDETTKNKGDIIILDKNIKKNRADIGILDNTINKTKVDLGILDKTVKNLSISCKKMEMKQHENTVFLKNLPKGNRRYIKSKAAVSELMALTDIPIENVSSFYPLTNSRTNPALVLKFTDKSSLSKFYSKLQDLQCKKEMKSIQVEPYIPFYLKDMYKKVSLEAYHLRKKKKMKTKISVVGGRMVLFGKLGSEGETGQYVKLAEYQF